MTVFDLFSGIGGFSLGLERAGFTTHYFCEIDPYCRGVLAKHWPHVPIFEDVRTVRGADITPVDLLCGGFPCQDISLAGKGAGLSGDRSGLWFEYARLIDEIRPRYVLIENVSALRARGLDRVLGSLAALGYDAEWHCIPACAVGAPHRRDRVWIVAHAARELPHGAGPRGAGREEFANVGHVAHAERLGSQGGWDGRAIAGSAGLRGGAGGDENEAVLSDANCQSERRFTKSWRQHRQWLPEPDVGRVAHGIPARVDRLRGLGNAIVPQIAELLGYAILAHAESVRLTEVSA